MPTGLTGRTGRGGYYGKGEVRVSSTLKHCNTPASRLILLIFAGESGSKNMTATSEDIHDLYPLLIINRPLLTTVVASILVATIIVWFQPLLSSSPTAAEAARPGAARSGGGGDEDDEAYKITKCPNPNCARCSRYAELNRSAQRRLPYVAKGEALRRIRHAIAAGPDVGTNDDEVRSHRAAEEVSPVPGQRPNVLLVRGLLSRPFVTHLHQDSCSVLENVDRNVLWNEYLEAMTSSYASALENDVTRGTWQVLHLMNQGEWVDSNVALCPKIMEVLKDLGKGKTMEACVFGNMFVSVLFPGTVIDPHCGPSNVRHRLHFPLKVPHGKGRTKAPQLCVAKEKTTWKEGQCFVFDDSIVHSVTFGNDVMVSSEKSNDDEDIADCRVVLIIDLWHPGLTREERHAITDLYPCGRFS